MALCSHQGEESIMMTTISNKRIARAVAHIHHQLDEELTLDALSSVACFSKYHFHRQFKKEAGIPVGVYIRLLRLKRASYQLAFRTHLTITDIAFSAGFENSESFSRVFKKTFEQTPSSFRKCPNWEPWYTINNDTYIEKVPIMQPRNETVKIVNFAKTKIAVLEHIGSPTSIMSSVQKFIAWRKSVKLSPKVSRTFNILHNDPAIVAPSKFHMDLCASITKAVPSNDTGVIEKTIPSGKCAVLRHIGSTDDIAKSCVYLFENWLSQSGEKLRDYPMFWERVSMFPDVAEHEMITDIYLPIE